MTVLDLFSPLGGGLAQWLGSQTTDQGVPGSRPGWVAVCCGLGQVTLPPALYWLNAGSRG